MAKLIVLVQQFLLNYISLHFTFLRRSVLGHDIGIACITKDLSHFLLKLLHKLSNNKNFKRTARLLLGETFLMEYIALLLVDICMYISIYVCVDIYKKINMFMYAFTMYIDSAFVGGIPAE